MYMLKMAMHQHFSLTTCTKSILMESNQGQRGGTNQKKDNLKMIS